MTHDDIKETNSEVLRIMSSVFTDMATSNEIADTCRTIEKMSFMLCNELRHQKKNPASFDDEYIKTLSAVSPIHDIGKVVIPQEILNKPGRLNRKEKAAVRKHPEKGYHMLLGIIGNRNDLSARLAKEVTLYHHEKWDGTGYPRGLKGDEIPLSARIIALVDVYHALRSKRCYKESYSHEESCSIIQEGSGTHFDPMVVSAFMAAAHRIDEMFERCYFEDDECEVAIA